MVVTAGRFSGTENGIAECIALAKEAASAHGCASFEFAKSPADRDSLWSARKQALWACLAVRPEGTEHWSTDVAVPISQMAKLIGTITSTRPLVLDLRRDVTKI